MRTADESRYDVLIDTIVRLADELETDHVPRKMLLRELRINQIDDSQFQNRLERLLRQGRIVRHVHRKTNAGINGKPSKAYTYYSLPEAQ